MLGLRTVEKFGNVARESLAAVVSTVSRKAKGAK
jgi:hypothetical protein